MKKTNEKIKIWICCKCGARDVDIVAKDAPIDQRPKIGPFSDTER
jgi:hypothetical protein